MNDPAQRLRPVPVSPAEEAHYRRRYPVRGIRPKAGKYTRKQYADAARMVAENTKLVHAFVLRNMRLTATDPDYDDAVQSLLFVLWRCALGFKPEFGWRFSTYAWGSMAREAKRLREREAKRGFVRAPKALAVEVHNADRKLLEDMPEPDTDADALADYPQVIRLLNTFSKRTRRIIDGRCGGMTYREIADEIGLSYEAVRQIEGKALTKLRRLVGV